MPWLRRPSGTFRASPLTILSHGSSGRAGLDASAYRPQSLDRRVPACLRVLRVRSPRAARTLLERRPGLIAAAVSALLIGATEFFREAEVFDVLRARVLPQLAAQDRRLRIWSAGCSTGAELYSVAILLSEAGLLERSCLLGTDCRGDAIQAAEVGLFDAAMLDRLPATRDKYFAPMERKWRVIEALRRQICWKVAERPGRRGGGAVGHHLVAERSHLSQT